MGSDSLAEAPNWTGGTVYARPATWQRRASTVTPSAHKVTPAQQGAAPYLALVLPPPSTLFALMASQFAGQTILITGGAGFIGSHVADALVAQGATVHILDDLSSGKTENVPDGATLHTLDIRSAEAAALFEHHGFDALVHLAAQMDVRASVRDPKFDAEVNVLGFLNLLEAARPKRRRARRLCLDRRSHLRRAAPRL